MAGSSRVGRSSRARPTPQALVRECLEELGVRIVAGDRARRSGAVDGCAATGLSGRAGRRRAAGAAGPRRAALAAVPPNSTTSGGCRPIARSWTGCACCCRATIPLPDRHDGQRVSPIRSEDARCRDHRAGRSRSPRGPGRPRSRASGRRGADRRRGERDQPRRPAAAAGQLPAAARGIAVPGHGVLGHHRGAGTGRDRLVGGGRGLRAARGRWLRDAGQRPGRPGAAGAGRRGARRRRRTARGDLHGLVDGVR